jgi:hypothetical protein
MVATSVIDQTLFKPSYLTTVYLWLLQRPAHSGNPLGGGKTYDSLEKCVVHEAMSSDADQIIF